LHCTASTASGRSIQERPFWSSEVGPWACA
jgi:hypothetical protein